MLTRPIILADHKAYDLPLYNSTISADQTSIPRELLLHICARRDTI